MATSSCVENSLWCYYEGGGVDNDLITTSLLTDGMDVLVERVMVVELIMNQLRM